MRVLHLYAGNLYGGIERLLGTFARLRHLAPEMRPEFGLCFRGRLWDELVAAGATVHDLGPVRLSRPWTVWRARRRLRAVLTAGGFEVVVCHACWPHVVFAPTVRSAGARLVTWAHDALTAGGTVNRWAARTRPDGVIANSRFTAGTVGTVFPGVPTEVVYLPVERAEAPADARRAVRAELATPDAAVVVLQASRLERWKGAAVLVEAFGLMRAVPGWVGWLAGGPQKAGEREFFAALQDRAAELGVADRVRFLGQRSDVPRLLAAADVYCQPNTGPEPFGVAYVEALAAGLPVVSTAIGGALEIVDQTCGTLVPPGDPAAAAAALVGLVRDADRRRALGAGGPVRAAALCDPAAQLAATAAAIRGTGP